MLRLLVRSRLRPQVKVPPGETASSWALGWQVLHTDHGDFIAHGGDGHGFHSMSVASIGRRSGFVVMTNGENGWQIIQKYLMTKIGELIDGPHRARSAVLRSTTAIPERMPSGSSSATQKAEQDLSPSRRPSGPVVQYGVDETSNIRATRAQLSDRPTGMGWFAHNVGKSRQHLSNTPDWSGGCDESRPTC